MVRSIEEPWMTGEEKTRTVIHTRYSGHGNAFTVGPGRRENKLVASGFDCEAGTLSESQSSMVVRPGEV